MFETLVEIWPEKVKNFEHKNILRIEKYFKFPVVGGCVSRMWATIIEISQKTFLIAPFCREFSTEFFKA